MTTPAAHYRAIADAAQSLASAIRAAEAEDIEVTVDWVQMQQYGKRLPLTHVGKVTLKQVVMESAEEA